jgi:hypothetical protein
MLVLLLVELDIFEDPLCFKQSLIRMLHFPESMSFSHLAYSPIIFGFDSDEIAEPVFSLSALNSGSYLRVTQVVLKQTSEKCVFQETCHKSYSDLFGSGPPCIMFILVYVLSLSLSRTHIQMRKVL